MLVRTTAGRKIYRFELCLGCHRYANDGHIKPRALQSSGVLTRDVVPRTIADAMNVVSAVDHRFLWVDALCIVQDHEMKQRFIEAMDAIYMHAFFCIVASSGQNANAGLSGWSNRGDNERVIPLSTLRPSLRLGVLPNLDVELMESDHAQRAWT